MMVLRTPGILTSIKSEEQFQRLVKFEVLLNSCNTAGAVLFSIKDE